MKFFRVTFLTARFCGWFTVGEGEWNPVDFFVL